MIEKAMTEKMTTNNNEQKNSVLDLHILHLLSQTEIIDLSSIKKQKLYLISVQKQNENLRLEYEDKDFFFVD